jgi:hypothetical protein
MSYNLFLDDVREPNLFLNDTRTWVIVRGYNDFVKIITERGLPEFISFDHDLADEHYNQIVDYEKYVEKTGYDCAKWLMEYCIKNNKTLPNYQIHSMNPVGRMNINMVLSTYESDNVKEDNGKSQ